MIKKILSFGVVGIIATIIDFLTLFVLKTGLGVNVYLATLLAFTISLLFNYFASMKYVFKVKEGLSIFKQTIIFLVTAILGMCINQVMMYLCIEFLNIFYMLAKVMATCVVMIFNFVSRYILLEK